MALRGALPAESRHIFYIKKGSLPGGALLRFDKLHRLVVADDLPAAGFFYHDDISAYHAPVYFTGLLNVYHPDCLP